MVKGYTRTSMRASTFPDLLHLQIVDILSNEGDQAEIVFTLIGEPPFTFTYQRSEPVSKKGGKPGKVLETHTVSRVTTNEYSVFSALEGSSYKAKYNKRELNICLLRNLDCDLDI